MENRPNNTLYINNLNEKISKRELKEALYALFTQFGSVADIVCLKTIKMRGQAFVAFDDITHATVAHRTLQSFPFYDKPMRIQFARTDSTVIAKTKTQLTDGRRSERVTNLSNVGKRKKRAHKDDEVPSRILYLTELPAETNEMMLSMLFSQFPGYKEVRLIPDRHDIGFVEFQTEGQAASAKDSLNLFKISPTHQLKIQFSKQ